MENKDMLQEILLRLPVKSLTRCKTLSKHWHNFISSNTPFRQTYLSNLKRNSPLMLGFFAHRFFAHNESPKPIRFLPVSGQGRQLKFGDSRKRKWDAPPLPHPFDETLGFLGLPHQPFISASSNGFLLCRLEEYYPISYYVCNPITKESIALPKATLTCRLLPTAFVSVGVYPCLSNVKYTIVRAIWNPITCFTNNLTVEIFSSEDFQWKVLHLTCPTPFQLDVRNDHTVIDKQGSVHWIANTGRSTITPSDSYITIRRNILVFDQRNNSLEIVQVPGENQSGCDCLCLSCGLVFFSSIVYPYNIQVWVVMENRKHKKEVFLKYKLSIQKNIRMFPTGWSFSNYTIMALHPFSPKVIFFSTISSGMVACYSAEWSTVHLVCQLPKPPVSWLDYKYAAFIWPNWPPFFP